MHIEKPRSSTANSGSPGIRARTSCSLALPGSPAELVLALGARRLLQATLDQHADLGVHTERIVACALGVPPPLVLRLASYASLEVAENLLVCSGSIRSSFGSFGLRQGRSCRSMREAIQESLKSCATWKGVIRVIRIHLTPEDLAETRFAFSPVWEAVQSVEALSNPGKYVFHLPWIDQARGSVGDWTSSPCAPCSPIPTDIAWTSSRLPEGPYPDFEEELGRSSPRPTTSFGTRSG